MAKTSVTHRYRGKANEPVPWDALVGIFDAIWGKNARLLPKFPKVVGGVHATWQDGEGVEHKAESLDEVGKAYERFETAFISFGSLGPSGGPRCIFVYHPAKSEAFIEVEAIDHATAEQLIAVVGKEFPPIAKGGDLLVDPLLSGLRLILVERFDEGELRDLCSDLDDVDYDGLPGRSQKDKARELVGFFKRREQVAELLATILRIRLVWMAWRLDCDYHRVHSSPAVFQ